MTFPNMKRVAEAYGIPSFTIEKSDDLEILRQELDKPGPALFDVPWTPRRDLSLDFVRESSPMERS